MEIKMGLGIGIGTGTGMKTGIGCWVGGEYPPQARGGKKQLAGAGTGRQSPSTMAWMWPRQHFPSLVLGEEPLERGRVRGSMHEQRMQ